MQLSVRVPYETSVSEVPHTAHALVSCLSPSKKRAFHQLGNKAGSQEEEMPVKGDGLSLSSEARQYSEWMHMQC